MIPEVIIHNIDVPKFQKTEALVKTEKHAGKKKENELRIQTHPNKPRAKQEQMVARAFLRFLLLLYCTNKFVREDIKYADEISQQGQVYTGNIHYTKLRYWWEDKTKKNWKSLSI